MTDERRGDGWTDAVLERVEQERAAYTGQRARQPRIVPPADEQTAVWRWLERARSRIPDSTIDVDTKARPKMPGYRSGLAELDAFTADHGVPGGGLYGLTAMAGSSKAKKSVLAANMVAIEAARDGWHVRVVSHELSEGEVQERAALYLGIDPERLGLEAPQWMRDRWRVLDITDPLSLPELITRLQDGLPPYEIDRLLVIQDSVSRFADDADGDYFQNIKDMWRFYRRLVKISNGAISALGVVELNQRGTDKGASAEYACNVLLKVEASPDGTVEVSMPKSRRTPIPKPLDYVGSDEKSAVGSFGKFTLQADRWRLAKWPPPEDGPSLDDYEPGEAF